MAPLPTLRSPVLLLIVVVSVGVALRTAHAQVPTLELDHAYVVVPNPPDAYVNALRAAGFVVDSTRSEHEGQGTASQSVIFEGAYIELLWVAPSVSVDDAQGREERAAAAHSTDWPTTGASPFGVGLRRIGSDTLDIGIPSRRYTTAWMGPSHHLELFRALDEPNASDVFLVGAELTWSSWEAWALDHRAEWFQHAFGGRRLTRIIVHGPVGQVPRALADVPLANVSFQLAKAPLLEIELDGGALGERIDLRPLLPVVFLR